MSTHEDDENLTPQWPINAPSDPLDLNESGFDPALDPSDDAADDSELDPELSQPQP